MDAGGISRIPTSSEIQPASPHRYLPIFCPGDSSIAGPTRSLFKSVATVMSTTTEHDPTTSKPEPSTTAAAAAATVVQSEAVNRSCSSAQSEDGHRTQSKDHDSIPGSKSGLSTSTSAVDLSIPQHTQTSARRTNGSTSTVNRDVESNTHTKSQKSGSQEAAIPRTSRTSSSKSAKSKDEDLSDLGSDLSDLSSVSSESDLDVADNKEEEFSDSHADDDDDDDDDPTEDHDEDDESEGESDETDDADKSDDDGDEEVDEDEAMEGRNQSEAEDEDEEMRHESDSDDHATRRSAKSNKSERQNGSRPPRKGRPSKDKKRNYQSISTDSDTDDAPTKSDKTSRQPSSKQRPTSSPAVQSSITLTSTTNTTTKPRELQNESDSQTQQAKKRAKLDLSNLEKRDRSGRTQLFKYTAMGDYETCKQLIEAGAKVNVKDHADWTPLHEACVTGHDKVAELLIQHQADVNAPGGHLDTPLHDAAQNGHVEVVKLLLSHGANVMAKNIKGVTAMDVTDDKEVLELLQRRQALINMITGKNQAGQTLLHRACSSGSYNNVVELLNQGADIHAQDNARWTPLHEAALAGHTKIVELLLSRGADPNAQGHGADTALHDSAQNEHEDVVRVLLEYGADPNMKNSKGETPAAVTDHEGILTLLKSGLAPTKKLTTAGATSNSPLSSLTSSNAHGSNKLSSSRADGEISEDQQSGIESRARTGQLSRDERKMQRLLSTIRMQEQLEERRKAKRKPPKPAISEEDEEGEERSYRSSTPQKSKSKESSSTSSRSGSHAHKSKDSTSRSKHESLSTVRRLSSSTPVSSSKRRSAKSEDQSASSSDDDEHEDGDDEEEEKRRYVVKKTTRSANRAIGERYRVDHRSRDSAGRTQLHQWSEQGDIEMVGTLLEGGVDLNATDNDGLTPLHLAARLGHNEIMGLLLAYGCNVNAQDHQKSTALHEAVRHRHLEAVKLLIQNNARVDLRDAKKRTCLDLASSKHSEIREVLRKARDESEAKRVEKSKKRISQSRDAHDSPKRKERKPNPKSEDDADEGVSSDASVSASARSKNDRFGSSSGNHRKEASKEKRPKSLVKAKPTSSKSSSKTKPSSSLSSSKEQEQRLSSSDQQTQRQRQHSRHSSVSDVEMKYVPTSKKRRETDAAQDSKYEGKTKIRKEWDDSPPASLKSSQESGASAKTASNTTAINNKSGTKSTELGSSRRGSTSSASGDQTKKMATAVQRSISPHRNAGSSSAAESTDMAVDKLLVNGSSSTPQSRKRTSQTFSSPSSYMRLADELKLVSNSTSSHRRKPSSTLARPNTSDLQSAHPSQPPTVPEPPTSRKRAKVDKEDSNLTSSSSLSADKLSATTADDGTVDHLAHSKPGIEDKAAESTHADKDVTVEAVPTNTAKIKTDPRLSSMLKNLALHRPELRSVGEAQRYLPLYTVQLSGEDIAGGCSSVTTAVAKETTSTKTIEPMTAQQLQQQHFCVVDIQVQLLLGLPPGSLFYRYPHFHRRLITQREKLRLWSPLSSMVSDRCAKAVKFNYESVLPAEFEPATAMSRLKEYEKQKFLGCELHFIRLEQVIEVIRQDYRQLNESMMTIMLDIGYDEAEMEDASSSSQETEKTKTKVEDEPAFHGLSKVKVKREEDDAPKPRPSSSVKMETSMLELKDNRGTSAFNGRTSRGRNPSSPGATILPAEDEEELVVDDESDISMGRSATASYRPQHHQPPPPPPKKHSRNASACSFTRVKIKSEETDWARPFPLSATTAVAPVPKTNGSATQLASNAATTGMKASDMESPSFYAVGAASVESPNSRHYHHQRSGSDVDASSLRSMHKMMRVPHKMAAKAMFKDMQQPLLRLPSAFPQPPSSSSASTMSDASR